MSRTYRTTKYGDKTRDKYKHEYNGCGCGYCEYQAYDFRNEINERLVYEEIKEHSDYFEGMYTGYNNKQEYDYDDDVYYYDELSYYIMDENNMDRNKDYYSF